MLWFVSFAFAQTKNETIRYINDKLKTHSSLMSGYYEIEVSEFGNLSIHRYDKTSFGSNPENLHFIDTFDFIDIKINPKVSFYNDKEYYSINFECNDSENCISENLIHNGIKRRSKISRIGITNKKIYLSLIEKFKYLQKISSKI